MLQTGGGAVVALVGDGLDASEVVSVRASVDSEGPPKAWSLAVSESPVGWDTPAEACGRALGSWSSDGNLSTTRRGGRAPLSGSARSLVTWLNISPMLLNVSSGMGGIGLCGRTGVDALEDALASGAATSSDAGLVRVVMMYVTMTEMLVGKGRVGWRIDSMASVSLTRRLMNDGMLTGLCRKRE